MNQTILLSFCTIMLFATMGCSSKSHKNHSNKNESNPTLDSVNTPVMQAKETPQDTSTDSKATQPKPATNSKSSAKLICTFVQEKRIIEIVPLEESGCKVEYTKYGETLEKARAINEVEICQQVQDKIKSNLETIGFDCTPEK